MGAYVQCGRNKVYPHNLIVEMAIFFVNTDAQGKHYTLIDVPVHGEQTDLRSLFQSWVMID